LLRRSNNHRTLTCAVAVVAMLIVATAAETSAATKSAATKSANSKAKVAVSKRIKVVRKKPAPKKSVPKRQAQSKTQSKTRAVPVRSVRVSPTTAITSTTAATIAPTNATTSTAATTTAAPTTTTPLPIDPNAPVTTTAVAPIVATTTTPPSTTTTKKPLLLPELPAVVPTTAAPSRPRPDPGFVLPSDLTPQEFVHVVITWAERVSVRRKAVNMPQLRTRLEVATAGAKAIPETYELVQAYLDALGDNHSTLYTPAQAKLLFSAKGKGFGFSLIDSYLFPLTNSPAALAGMQDRDRLVSINGVPEKELSALRNLPDTSTFEIAREGVPNLVITITRGDITTSQRPITKALDDRLGYMELPGLTGSSADEKQFAQAGISGIQAVDATPRCGWVLDLRRNTGGFPYTMLSAITPFIGNGDVAAIVDADGGRNVISVRDDKIVVNGNTVSTGPFYRFARPDVPIAILTSSATASAGELAQITLLGRPNVRVFGQPTFGVPSGNVGINFPDGSFVAVTSTYDADRLNRLYTGPIVPDEPSAPDWSKFQSPADPTVLAATSWLRAQPGCV
jgi:carboxyl-terminal processing protease